MRENHKKGSTVEEEKHEKGGALADREASSASSKKVGDTTRHSFLWRKPVSGSSENDVVKNNRSRENVQLRASKRLPVEHCRRISRYLYSQTTSWSITMRQWAINNNS